MMSHQNENRVWAQRIACGAGFYFISIGLLYAFNAANVAFTYSRLWLFTDDIERRMFLGSGWSVVQKAEMESNLLTHSLASVAFLVIGIVLARRLRRAVNDFTGTTSTEGSSQGPS